MIIVDLSIWTHRNFKLTRIWFFNFSSIIQKRSGARRFSFIVFEHTINSCTDVLPSTNFTIQPPKSIYFSVLLFYVLLFFPLSTCHYFYFFFFLVCVSFFVSSVVGKHNSLWGKQACCFSVCFSVCLVYTIHIVSKTKSFHNKTFTCQ